MVDKFKDRASDALSNGMATWGFLGGLTGFLIASVIWNVAAPVGARYDPYPFILLNLFMSALAAVTAPILLMSQNRQAARDRLALLETEKDTEADLNLDTQALELIKRIAGKLEIE